MKTPTYTTRALILAASLGLVWLTIAGISSSQAESSGPGTGEASIPEPFSRLDFPSVIRAPDRILRAIAPPVLEALGECKDPLDGAPKSPVDFDLRLETHDDVSSPWVAGESHELVLVARSSSFRFVETPPRIDLWLVGGSGGAVWIDLGYPLRAGAGPVHWAVPSLSDGQYRFHLFDRATGLCKASEFGFSIASLPQTDTPTPTQTEIQAVTQTPTPTSTTGAPSAVMRSDDSGPGTTAQKIPLRFSERDLETVRRSLLPFASSTSPAILSLIGACKDPEGNPPNSPIEYDVRITTPDDVSVPWGEGETHEIYLEARSSSMRFVHTPPRFDLLLVGQVGAPQWIPGGPFGVDEDPILFQVSRLVEEEGIYEFRIHGFDRSTGLCRASEFSFNFALSIPGPANTPTVTESPTHIPTPSDTVTPEATPTSTFDYDIWPEAGDGRIDARDLLLLIQQTSDSGTVLFDFARFWKEGQ